MIEITPNSYCSVERAIELLVEIDKVYIPIKENKPKKYRRRKNKRRR